jgi:HEAT repeat protein
MKSPTRCLPFLVLSFLAQAGGLAMAVAEVPEEPVSVRAALRSLTTGTLQERVDVAKNAADLYAALAKDPDGMPGDEFVAQLRDAMNQEPDDWVGRTMLAALLDESDPTLAPLFRAALDSRSPNLRAMAVRWFVWHANPESLETLEALWKTGVPAWAQSDLMDALVNQGSTRFTRDFIGLAHDPDRAVRIRALRALGTLADDNGLPALLEASREKDRWIAEEGLEGLSRWPGSEMALDAVLAGSRSGAPSRSAAVTTLGSFHEERSGERLIEILDDAESNDLHDAAAESLEDSSHPGATDALVRSLRASFAAGDEGLSSTILRVLHNRADSDARPALQQIAASLQPPGDGDRPQRDLLELIDYLDPATLSSIDRSVIIVSHCGGVSLDGPDHTDPYIRHIVPPAGQATVRCWDHPAFAGPSWNSERITAGTVSTPVEFFDRDGETWMSFDSCWVPERMSARGAGSNPVLSPAATERDVPASALETQVARKLLAAGVLRAFDAEGDVVAVAIQDLKDVRLKAWFDELRLIDIDIGPDGQLAHKEEEDSGEADASTQAEEVP